MIEKIIAKSRTTGVHATSRLLINAYNESGLPADPFLPVVMTNLETTNAELGMAIDRSKAESIKAEKDDKRDYDLRSVGYLVEGYTWHPEQAICDAANTVKKVFDKYGFSVAEESYTEESSHIVSMLGDFAHPDIQAAIDLLSGLGQNIANLRASNDDFETASTKFAEEEAEESTKKSATTLKKEVVNIINNDLVMFLRTGQRFQPEFYGSFASTIAKLIADHNEQVKKREKKDKPEKD